MRARLQYGGSSPHGSLIANVYVDGTWLGLFYSLEENSTYSVEVRNPCAAVGVLWSTLRLKGLANVLMYFLCNHMNVDDARVECAALLLEYGDKL